MATVAAVFTKIEEFGEKSHVITWGPLTTTNRDGSFIKMPGSHIRSVQVLGTFSAGSPSVQIEGTNDPTDPPSSPVVATLNEPQGNPLAFTAAAIEEVQERTLFIRPNLTGGDGSTSLTVRLLVIRRG